MRRSVESGDELLDYVAAVVSQTYVAMGDDAPIADDQALSMIRDRIEEFSPHIIDRNRTEGKKLAKVAKRLERR